MEKLLANHRDNDEYLELLRNNAIPLGLGIGCELDNYLRYKVGNYNIILGHANVGKTYWVLWYLLCLSVKHNLKHLIYSAENTINGLKRNLIELFMNKKIVNMTATELEEGKKFIESSFDFINVNRLWEIDEFMKEVQLLNTTYDTIVIDPHNSFKKPFGVNAHEHDYLTASKLRLFAKKYECAVYMCCHASTEALRKVHKGGDFDGLTVPPNAADAEGGGKWVNRADDFLVIHRYINDPNNWMYTHVHVKKVKETETGGAPTFMDDPVRFKLSYGTEFTCDSVNPIKKDVIRKEITLEENLGFDEEINN